MLEIPQFLRPKDTSAHTVESSGPVRYYDGSALSRPLDLPKRYFYLLGAIALAALVIGVSWGINCYANVVYGSQDEQEAVNEMLTRGETVQSPALINLVGLDAQGVIDTQAQQGQTVIDISSVSKNTEHINVIKLPSDVTAVDALAYYSKGISNLSASEAVKLLTGSWRLEQQNAGSTDLHLTYADFTSGTVDAAVTNAMADQGFDSASVTDSGVDSNGNTYQKGTIEVDGATYTWTVSACALSEVYDNSGLPSTAQYVGVRLAA